MTAAVQRIGQCERKRSYPSEAAAQSVVFAIRARGGSSDGLAPYACGLCHLWHVGRPLSPASAPAPVRRALRLERLVSLPYKDDD